MQKLNIEHLNEKELQALYVQVGKKLYGFWPVIEELLDIQTEEEHFQAYIRQKKDAVKAKSKQIEELKAMGFTVTTYAKDRVGIINYAMPQKEGIYYGATYFREPEGIRVAERNLISKEDLLQIKEILEDKV